MKQKKPFLLSWSGELTTFELFKHLIIIGLIGFVLISTSLYFSGKAINKIKANSSKLEKQINAENSD